MKICVLDAWNFGDPALQNSHWIAHKTRSLFEATWPDCVVTVLGGEEVNQAQVRAKLEGSWDGFLYCGHGRENLLYRLRDASGQPVPVLGTEEIALIGEFEFCTF